MDRDKLSRMAKRGMGTVYRRGRFWWICYWKSGKPNFESSKSERKEDAIRILKIRQGEVEAGMFVQRERTTMHDLFALVLEDYTERNCRSLYETKLRIDRHLDPFFGKIRVTALTSQDAKRYVRHRRQSDPHPAPATLNREFAIVKRAFRIAAEMTPPIVGIIPHLPTFKENNVREGFLDDRQYRILLNSLPAELRLLFVIGFHVGCRKGELLGLTWPQVNLSSREIRLRHGETKNDEGRTLPIYGDMLPWLEMAHAEHLQRYPDCRWVFHREGKRIVDFRGAWAEACTRSGIPGLRFHDLRRSAVRNMERAGIPRSVAMKISGHKTESVYRRYAIVSQRDLRDAAAKMDQFFQETITKTITAESPGDGPTKLSN